MKSLIYLPVEIFQLFVLNEPEWTLEGCVLQVLLSAREIHRHNLYILLWCLWSCLLCISQFETSKSPHPP